MTKLDFSILENLDVQRMLFLDTSEYTKNPALSRVSVKFPDFKKIYTTNINFNEINILNTARLKYSDCIIDFPDGVYEISYSIENCEISKTIFRTTKAWNKLRDLLKTADYNNKYLLETFNKINLYLHGAEAIVESNSTQAQELYKQAMSLISCY